MKKIAISGSIGTGKSYVCNKLQECGYFCMNMDMIAKQVRKEKESEIKLLFNVTNNKELAAVIFNDIHKKQQLEELLYPRMIEIMLTEMNTHTEDIFIEVPLLFEKQWECYFDECWIVYASEEVALQRLIKQRSMEEQEAMNIINQQLPIEEKVSKADFVIYNNGNEDVLKQIKERMNNDVK